MIAFFNAVQIIVSGYALWKGGIPERIVALMLVAASLATLLVPTALHAFHSVFWSVLWIDLILLAGLTGVAAFADRFWPIWIAACQFVTVVGHGLRAYEPELWAMAYWSIISIIAYPMLAMLVLGVWRHRRRSPSGHEFAWTVQRHRHERAAGAKPTLH